MSETNSGFTRRRFIKGTVAMVGAAALPFTRAVAQGAAKYRRYNVMSDGGQKALASYARGVEAMLKLKPDHPHNWFRNAFVHLMDCPHGNWWFYVWHRGFIGYFEQTIRTLSGDPTFAIPYWDWTTLPQIPDSMFSGVLNPQDVAYEPYTRNFAVFTSYIRPALESYWKSLDPDQRTQLKNRGYVEFENLWNAVTAYDPNLKPPHGVSSDMAFAPTCSARYLSRDNPKLDEKTAVNVSERMVYSGLLPTDFYNPIHILSFNSSKTPSHNTQPGGSDWFSTLEGFPHNKVHNYIGGVGPLDPGPYGYMTNNLSPVDPIFFLHHSNMDRLWDVWTRKQQRLKLPYLPEGPDLETLSKEPFLFYVNAKGEYVGPSHAGDYLSMEKFEYDYEPGFGEKIVESARAAPKAKRVAPLLKGIVKGNAASIAVPSAEIEENLAAEFGSPVMVEVTLPRPSSASSAREFDVIVGAPPDVTQVSADSPYYAGTIAFFGSMTGMNRMPEDATFVVPLPKAREAFRNLGPGRSPVVNIRVVPSHGHGEKAPVLKSASVRELQ